MRTYEWNAAAEQRFAPTWVSDDTSGRKLMRQDLNDASNPNFTGEVDIMRSGATSSYNALQCSIATA